MSAEKITLVRAMGADVIITRSDVERGHPDYYQDLAKSIAEKSSNHYYIDQFNNPANPKAHRESTGPELYSQMQGQIDAIVCGVGSGGTITGLSQYFSSKIPSCEFVVADPKGSIIAPFVNTGQIPAEVGSWIVEGIGEDFLPSLLDLSRAKKAYSISDIESFAAAQELLLTNGLLAGSSTGTLLAAALKYCQEQTSPKRVVTFLCDSGNRYLSKVFNQNYILGEGLKARAPFNDLRDYVFSSFGEGSSIYVRPKERLESALKRMKMFGISQLPVLEDEKVVGIIDEHDIMTQILESAENLKREISSCMTSNPITLRPEDSLKDLLEILQKGMVGILTINDKFYGVITRSDVITAERLKNIKH